MSKPIAAVTLLLAVAGCATRGPLRVECDVFDDYTHDVEQSTLISEIQDGAGPINVLPVAAIAVGGGNAASDGVSAGASASGETGDPMQAALNAMAAGQFVQGTAAEPAVLLLSGGGQWGAFGAGFLAYLHAHQRLPAFQTITGVSTGGLQSLFVAVDDPAYYAMLLKHYAPESEDEIVDRHSRQAMAALTGSVAGLKPLRKKIEQAICTGAADDAASCPMIGKLAGSNRNVYIGFVEAQSGKMQYFDVVRVAKQAPVLGYRKVQQCLTGAALASAAMPGFFQQVRVQDKTYYDGGVRQSVFEVSVADKITKAVTAQKRLVLMRNGAAPAQTARLPLYVIRNGPTTVKEDNVSGKPENCNADCKADLITNVLRAEAIVVNELEIGSIAALRLVRPDGPISLITADGYNSPFKLPNETMSQPCVKPKAIMFDPDFMVCLQKLGRSKAYRDPAWRPLSEIKLATPINAPTPTRSLER